jgi:hypothetical protein
VKQYDYYYGISSFKTISTKQNNIIVLKKLNSARAYTAQSNVVASGTDGSTASASQAILRYGWSLRD